MGVVESKGTLSHLIRTTLNANVLLIGAYERDNFGDLLFYQLTREYLGDHNIVAGSIIGADMTSLLGTHVYPHNDLLASRAWDLIWVVGGEIGGVDAEGALAMSLDETEGRIFDAAGTEGKHVIARYLSGASAHSPAYLPVKSKFPLNAQTPLVINSVGLGNTLPADSARSGDSAVPAIRSAAAIVVRDAVSYDFAKSIGKESVLSPDMVHAISLQHPELASSAAEDDPYFIFQSSAHLIEEFGAEAIARSLARVATETGWRPAFFLAGTARHHDRKDQYDGIKSALEAIAPEVHPIDFGTRRPMKLASKIASSKLWIGTSLHGRIIASSFSLPRVSLTNLKVATYAATWDSDFPINIEFDGLSEAVSNARAASEVASNVAASREIAELADQKTKSLVREFL